MNAKHITQPMCTLTCLVLTAFILATPRGATPDRTLTSQLNHSPEFGSSYASTEDHSELSPTRLLQFTAGGHVAGFQPDGFYLASMDHVLRVEFVGARGVVPVAEKAASGEGITQPLIRVSYAHLWEGISLAYEAAADGIARSTYVIDPGARPDQILLRYNVPFELDGDGSLHLTFPTGEMNESAPAA